MAQNLPFKKILDICKRQMIMPATISEVNGQKFVDCFEFGPAGMLLKHNFYNEWLLHNVTSCDCSVFPFSGNGINSYKDLLKVFTYVKNLSSSQVPFGLVDTRSRSSCDSYSNNDNQCDENIYFKSRNHTSLRRMMFCSPEKSIEYFHYWQRQRRIWWRKFAASPGRFSLTDIRCEGDGQSVEIVAEFPWGKHSIENIRYLATKPFDEFDEADVMQFEVKDGRKKVMPHVIENVTTLESGVFTYLCDAYDEFELLGVTRDVLRFHRKLAPYKACFAASATSATISRDLEDLALYLTKEFRKAGISTLLLPDVSKKSLEAQFVRNDELGVPYTVVLNEATLKTGILGLRSRDTTIKEQVHVTKITEHVDKLLKYYQ